MRIVTVIAGTKAIITVNVMINIDVASFHLNVRLVGLGVPPQAGSV